jgi:S-DNA-T family DNA segregation ATPase FtsK/SpoIIIE
VLKEGSGGPIMRTDPSKRATQRSIAGEVVAVVLIATAIIVLLSLVTYNARDSSWNSVGPDHSPSNLIGRLGAHLSDIFLQMFGLAAFTLPLILVGISVRALFGNNPGLPVRKAAGASLLLVALSGLLALLPRLSLDVLANSRNGGAVGYVVAEALARIMNTAGAAIVLAAISLLTLMLAMDVSLSSLLAIVALATKSIRLRLGARERPDQTRPDSQALEHRTGVLAGFFSTIGSQIRHRTEQTPRAGATIPVGGERAQLGRGATPRRGALPGIAASSALAGSEGQQPAELPATLPASAFDQTQESEFPPFDPYPDDSESLSPSRTSAGGEGSKPGKRSPQPGEMSGSADTYRPTGSARPASEVASVVSNLGGTQASPVTMDPDVAEMISTASIVRNLSDGDTGGSGPGDPAITSRQRKKPFQKPLATPGYSPPSMDLLETPISHKAQAEEELRERATILAEKCKEFSVTGHIHRINPGPVVTTFEFKPDPGIKYSRVVSLGDDLCLALKAESIRIDRIPGKSTVGIEVPNALREKIYLREVVESPKFQNSESRLTIALGKTINGDEYAADLIKMPHLLIAGATGAGKSVTLNAIICSILYKASPEEVKFIMVDPKRLELGLYEGIPHLLTPIVTEPKRAANALKWATNEMENRYRELAKFGVRNIDQYNQQIRETTHPTLGPDDPEAPKPLPYIVITIDELADLMMVARGDVETSIARLAQMARAVGIHLVVATQRPSVDVITGVIKANFPSRIAFRVSSKVDSRTIIDANGAEGLLGQGDMLFLPPASSRLIRVHGSFVNEVEIKRITDHTRNQAKPDYNEQVTQSEQEVEGVDEIPSEQDDLFDDALAIVTDMGRASTSVLQRRLSIGYGRAAKILDLMERGGFIGPNDGSKPRKVLSAAYEFRERVQERLEDRGN